MTWEISCLHKLKDECDWLNSIWMSYANTNFGSITRSVSRYMFQDSLPYGSTEQHRILEDDGETRPQRVQREFTDVDPVDDDLPCKNINKHYESTYDKHKPDLYR